MTNVYTKPGYRRQGIGSALMQHVQQWARKHKLELLIVWPSEASVPFYERAGFRSHNDVMEYVLEPDAD